MISYGKSNQNQSENGVVDGTLTLNKAIKVDTFGRHIASHYNASTETFVYNVNSLTNDQGSIETFYLEYDPKEFRVVTNGNYADAWVGSKVYALGDVARPTVSNGFIYKATVAGISGDTQPTWPTVLDATVVNGAVTWQCIAAEDKSGPNRDGAYPVVYGDYTNTVSGTVLEYSALSSADIVVTKVYLRLALTSVMTAGDIVRIRAYHGNVQDESKLIYEKTRVVDEANLTPASGTNYIEVALDVENVEYHVGEVVHWHYNLQSSNATHTMVAYCDAALRPWRAVDGFRFTRMQIAPYSAFFAASSITAPANNATGVAVLPTFTVAKGTAGSGQLDFTADKYKFQIKRNDTQEVVHTSAELSTASYTLPSDNILSGASYYSVRGRIKSTTGIWLPYSAWNVFRTEVTRTVTFTTTGVTAGDLIQIRVGESAFATGFDFHLASSLTTFPPAAFDSGSLQFRDGGGTALNFRVDTVTGSTPSRTATIVVETNARTITDGNFILSEQS